MNWRRLAIAALIATIGVAVPADAKHWRYAGHSRVPLEYFQGMTSGPHGRLYFDGVFSGLYRTDRRLREKARVLNVIPSEVTLREGYNHVGDITWDPAEGGRIVLPLECYLPIGGNTCGTGSFAAADPVTLRWLYYVKLDPAFIPKAMWVEASPDGKLLWTSSGRDLLAYRGADVVPANAAPVGPMLRPIRVLRRAVPRSGITGAAFYRGRLLLAGQATGPFQVWSVNPRTGTRRLEIERYVTGESEGLDAVSLRRGRLHWIVTPFRSSGRFPTFGIGHSAVMHFAPRR